MFWSVAAVIYAAGVLFCAMAAGELRERAAGTPMENMIGVQEAACMVLWPIGVPMALVMLLVKTRKAVR